MNDPELIAANCVSVLGYGVLIFGPSGSGKSDLTLRLLHMASPLLDTPCKLVADDQTLLECENGAIYGSAPSQIAGKLEVRGVGVMTFERVEKIKISLVLKLTASGSIERIPELRASTTNITGTQLPMVKLNPFEASACEKVVAIVHALTSDKLANEI